MIIENTTTQFQNFLWPGNTMLVQILSRTWIHSRQKLPRTSSSRYVKIKKSPTHKHCHIPLQTPPKLRDLGPRWTPDYTHDHFPPMLHLISSLCQNSENSVTNSVTDSVTTPSQLRAYSLSSFLRIFHTCFTSCFISGITGIIIPSYHMLYSTSCSISP